MTFRYALTRRRAFRMGSPGRHLPRGELRALCPAPGGVWEPRDELGHRALALEGRIVFQEGQDWGPSWRRHRLAQRGSSESGCCQRSVGRCRIGGD